MEIRKYKSFDAFNALKMSEFWLDSIEYGNGPFQNVTFLAARGYMSHFGAEIKFLAMEYIVSARFFTNCILRLASQQEVPFATEYSECNVYCFEENDSPLGTQPERFYIVAKDMEVTAHYAGENVEIAFGLSDQFEKKLQK